MGRLVHIASGGTHLLAAHTVVGRAPSCLLRIDRPEVSATHASLAWSGGAWVVRDLGSRNGTLVDGLALEPGESRTLEVGAELGFGGEPTWRLVEAGAPVAHARSGDEIRLPHDDLLLLPASTDPELVLFFDPDAGWVRFDGEQRHPVEDGAVVAAGGLPWTLALPVPVEATFQPDAALPDLEQVAVHFAVSSDEEHVEVRLRGPDGWCAELAPRSYHYMLLTLARERERDHDLAEPEQGWVHRDELAKMLRVGPRTLTVHLCRAHKQIGDAGVLGAAELFEHRPATRQVRLNLRVGGIDALGA